VVYILEDNGVYGLTKGQFSATADIGSVLKKGDVNELTPIDPCTLAMELGCGFVARGFSGNPKQLNTILKAAFAHEGTALIDVISPCVTFNNHEGSTKSLKYVKGHLDPIHDLDFVPPFENIEADYDEGTDHEVSLHDGSRIILHKLSKHYDPTSKSNAIQAIHGAIAEGKFLTGLIYYNPNRKEFAEELNLPNIPLSELGQDILQPPVEALERINADMMK